MLQTKRIFILLVFVICFFKAQSQYRNNPFSDNAQYDRYNAVTLGSQVGKSVINSAKSFVLYNFNQIVLSDRFYFSTYAEYYKDENNLFLSNYFNGQAFVNFKLQPKFICGVGFRYNNNFSVNQQEKFIQLKLEKSFTW